MVAVSKGEQTNMKKRILLPLSSILLLGGLVGCTGNSSDTTPTPSKDTTTPSKEDTTPTQTPSEELDPIASFDNSELADNSYGGWTGTAYSVLLYEGNL